MPIKKSSGNVAITKNNLAGHAILCELEKMSRMLILIGLVLVIGVSAGIWVKFQQKPKALSDLEKRVQIEYLYEKDRLSFREIPTLKVDQLQDWLKFEKDRVLILDVRYEREWKVSMIPGAITLNEFEKNPQSYLSKRIVTYCSLGYRSGVAASKLKSRGFDVYNLYGGVLAWSHYPNTGFVDSEGKPTNKVHVFGKDWDLLAKGYESIY